MKHAFWLIPIAAAVILLAGSGLFVSHKTVRDVLPPAAIEVLDHLPHSELRDQ